MNNKKNRIRKGFTATDVMLGTAMVLLCGLAVKGMCMYVPGARSFLYGIISADSMLDLLLNQYTITFLIVSLLSLLSGNCECIYWVNILEQKIIKPLHRNFISLTIYAFLSMFAGTLAYIVKDLVLVITYFFMDACILVVLTLKMVGVFFGKAKIQRSLHREIVDEVRGYLETKDTDKLNSISTKLNGMYENAYRLSKDGKYEEILKTDFQLLVDLIKLLPDQYDERLVKALYDTLSKIVNLYAQDPEILLSEISGKDPEKGLKYKKQTEMIIQCALCSLFEIILSNREYRVAYDRWLEDIYIILSDAYKKIDEELNCTIIFRSDEGFEYHNLLVDVWNTPLKVLKNAEEHIVTRIENNVASIRGKLVHFARLLYVNSPSLFFDIVSRNGMDRTVQRHLELLKLVCRHDAMPNAIMTCRMMCRRMHLLKVCKYLEQYEIYSKMPTEVQGIHMEHPFDKKDFYELNPLFEAMLRYAAFGAKSPEILECLLGELNSAVIKVCIIIEGERADSPMEMERMLFGIQNEKHPMLINDQTWEDLYTNMKMTGMAPEQLMADIETEYAGYAGIMDYVRKPKPLCAGNYDLSGFRKDQRVNKAEFGF